MPGEFTIVIKVKTNSDNYGDVRRAAENAILRAVESSDTIVAVQDIEIERGWNDAR